MATRGSFRLVLLSSLASAGLLGCGTICDDAADAARECGASDVASAYDSSDCDLDAAAECEADCVIDAECSDFDVPDMGQTNVSGLEVCRASCR